MIVEFRRDDPAPILPPEVLIYEAEWNEEASADEHMEAVRYFAAEKGIDEALVLAAAEEFDWTRSELDDATWFVVAVP